MSRKLEALIDAQADLRVKINLEADRAEADAEKLMAMSRRLAQVEREIAAEQKQSRPE